MPMADKDARSARATVMAVNVARVATEVIVVIVPSVVSARTGHRWTTSSRWKALPQIPEDQVHCQGR